MVCQTLRREFGSYEYLGIVMGVFAVFFVVCARINTRHPDRLKTSVYTRVWCLGFRV